MDVWPSVNDVARAASLACCQAVVFSSSAYLDSMGSEWVTVFRRRIQARRVRTNVQGLDQSSSIVTAVLGMAAGVSKRASRGAYAREGLLRVYDERRAIMSVMRGLGVNGRLKPECGCKRVSTNLRDPNRRHPGTCSPGQTCWPRSSSCSSIDPAVWCD